jgi:hypothetical protein
MEKKKSFAAIEGNRGKCDLHLSKEYKVTLSNMDRT